MTTIPTTRDPEAGSAYLAVLLVLVILTILGLSLALITQTEMEVGSNERSIQRVFYEANSGVAVAAARVLVTNEHRPVVLNLDEPGSLLNFRSQVDIAPVVPLSDAPCNLCEVNNAGTYNERAYRKINHVVTATAVRLNGADGTAMAQKTVSSMLEVQPWRSVPEAYAAIGDPAQLQKIKF